MAQRTPSPRTARAWSDVHAIREYGSTAIRTSFIKRIGEPGAFRRRPFDRLVGEFDAFWRGDLRSGRRAWCRRRPADRGIAGRLMTSTTTGRGDGQPRRHMLGHPVEQGGDIARHAWRGRERPSDRRRAACRSQAASCRSEFRASRRRRRRSRQKTLPARAPGGEQRRRVHAGLSGARLAPVMATRRPPSQRRAKR